MERELQPSKERLQADRRSTEKYDEKVDEWKVGNVCCVLLIAFICQSKLIISPGPFFLLNDGPFSLTVY